MTFDDSRALIDGARFAVSPSETRTAAPRQPRNSVPVEWRREMRTIEARARSEGRTPAGRPDGLGKGQRRAVIAPSVQGWVLPHLIAWVESRRVNASPIRRLFGRTRLDDPNVRVPEAVTETAWRLAATLTCDDALGIHLAESLPAARSTSSSTPCDQAPISGKGSIVWRVMGVC